ncbi:MAG: hypothetical protein D6722_08515, partial [Bacteroidetes bacterium]
LWLTSLTTAIGFASLATARIPVFVEFGLFVAIGVGVSLTFTLLVFLCFPFKVPPPLPWVDQGLGWLLGWVHRGQASARWRWGLLLAAGIIVAGGLPQLRQNALLISGLPADAPIRVQARFFDETFGGSRPLSFLVEPPAGASPAQVKEGLAQTEALIRAHYPVAGLLTPALHRPDLPMMAPDSSRFRFWGLIPDEGSARLGSRGDAFRADRDAHPDLETWRIHYTGVGRMVDKNTEETTWQIAQGLVTALGLTFGLLLLYFRRWREPLIAVVVNVVPLLLLAAVYGWLGVELRAGTNIAFTIAFGIAIDDTMHLLNVYRKQPPEGCDFGAVTRHAGRPVILTSLVLGLSFAVLILAQLDSIRVLGLAMAVSAITALLADLFLLPLLLKQVRSSHPTDSS